MKKAVYRLILFAAITAFVLPLSVSVKAEPNSTEPNQQVSKAATTSTTYKPEPAPHQKSAGSIENSQFQLAKEQLRGDSYKDDVDNLKFALTVITGLIAAFITFAFISIGIILFKNKKDYEHALADAKEAARDAKDAAKNAHELEKEAQGILAQAKTTLNEIDIKAQEKLESIDKLVADKLEEIEKTSKEQKEESSKEFERQRKISELFSKGLTAYHAKDYETAADCYRQIVEEHKEKNNLDVYVNWGAALAKLATSKKGPQAEELLNQAIEKYKKAIEIKPDCDAYNNWGIVLADLAENKKGKEAEKLFNQAIEKYKKAIEIKPDYCSAYNNWGNALSELAKLKGDKDAEDLFNQAEEKCLKAESLKTGKGAYNLACVYALRGNEEKSKEWLKVSEKARTLTTREHVMADDDLKSVREKEWFKKLRWEGE